jgi:hypothetical protein
MLFHNPVVLARRFATLDLLSEGRTICGFKPIQNHIFRFIWEGLVHIQTIKKELQSWPYVTAEPYRFGGLEFRLNKREMGHIHGDRVADLPFLGIKEISQLILVVYLYIIFFHNQDVLASG